MKEAFAQLFGDAPLPKHDFYLGSADKLCPLDAGDELLIDTPNAEVNQEIDFRFEVAFNEPQVAQPEPMLGVLIQATDLVDGLIRGFEPLV